MPSGGKKTDITISPSQYSVQRTGTVSLEDRTIRGVDPNTWFGPLQPIPSQAPDDQRGRQFNYQVGENLSYTPKDEGIDFPTLRGLADSCTLIRGAIETRKDQMYRMDWSIKLRDTKLNEKQDPAAKKIQDFLKYPDGVHDYATWGRMLDEDMIVIDAPTILPRRTKGGEMYALEIVSGDTVKVLIGADGRSPMPPSAAYQQVIHGIPCWEYTREELIYAPRNPRANKLYGYSYVEQAVMYVNMCVRRDLHKLAYYTDGTVPDAFLQAADGWSPEQIETYDKFINGLMAGNSAERRKLHIVPHGSNVLQFKDAIFKDEFDDLIARVFCWLIGISPQGLVKEMNKATAQNVSKMSHDEGLEPHMRWRKAVMDRILRDCFGRPDMEFRYLNEDAEDELKLSQSEDLRIKNNSLKINEARETRGLESVPWGEDPFTDNSPPQAMPGEGPGGSPPSPPENPPPAEGDSKKKIAKRGKLPPVHNPHLDLAVAKLTTKLHKFLSSQAKLIAPKIAKAFASQKMAKAEDSGLSEEQQKELDRILNELDWQVIVTETGEGLEQIGKAAARLALAQIGFEDDESMFSKADPLVVEYAKSRSAEMVGMKLVNGELVQNPDAKWRIDETTRDEIRTLVTKSVDEGLPYGELETAIQESGSFSESRAHTIAETELRLANTKGSLAGWKASGVSMKKVNMLSADHAGEDECNDATSEGAVDLDADFEGGEGPPWHPNCMCVLAPVVSEDQD